MTAAALPADGQLAADLAVTLRDAPDPVLRGRNLTYTASVENTGPDTAAGAVLSLTLPRTEGLLAVTTTPPVKCTGGARSERCVVGTLAPAQSRSIRIVIRPATAGRVTATATVTSTTPDSLAANDRATASTAVNGPPRLIIDALSRVPKLPRSGEKFYMSIAVRRSDTGGVLDVGNVMCPATVSGKPVRVLVHDAYPSPTCVWRVLPRTKGQIMRGSIGVRFRGATASRRFALRIL